MIIASTRNTTRWMWPTPRRIGSPERPICCSANPTSSATSSVCSTSPDVRPLTSEVGMMPSRNSVVLPCPAAACSWPALVAASVRCSPSPGLMMLPTMSPSASANVDMVMK